jgi:hypothetical protein
MTDHWYSAYKEFRPIDPPTEIAEELPAGRHGSRLWDTRITHTSDIWWCPGFLGIDVRGRAEASGIWPS